MSEHKLSPETALEIIAMGLIGEFPGAPDMMEYADPLEFRAAMWSWSQKVAQAALDARRDEETP